MRKLWEQEQALVLRAIAMHAHGHPHALIRMVTMQLQHASGRLAAELSKSSRDALSAGVTATAMYVRRMQPGQEITVDSDIRLRHIVEAARPRIEEMRRSTMASVGAQIEDQVQKAVTLAALAGENEAEFLFNRLRVVLEDQWWRIERAIVTETAFAFNLAARLSIPDLGTMQRWTEMIDNHGKPLDDKVADDSVELHAQVAPAGGMFVMPPNEKVPEQVGRMWRCPPNRPNDRAILTPWSQGWGVPAWIWDGHKRKWLERTKRTS